MHLTKSFYRLIYSTGLQLLKYEFDYWSTGASSMHHCIISMAWERERMNNYKHVIKIVHINQTTTTVRQIQSCNHIYTWIISWSEVNFVWRLIKSNFSMEQSDFDYGVIYCNFWLEQNWLGAKCPWDELTKYRLPYMYLGLTINYNSLFFC